MLGLLERLLRNGTPAESTDWLGQHPDAVLHSHWGNDKQHRVIFRDKHSDQVANYRTDAIGNVEEVDVYSA